MRDSHSDKVSVFYTFLKRNETQHLQHGKQRVQTWQVRCMYVLGKIKHVMPRIKWSVKQCMGRAVSGDKPTLMVNEL